MSIIYNFLSIYFLFVDASLLVNSLSGGCGFYIINSSNKIFIVGYSSIVAESALESELAAVELGL